MCYKNLHNCNFLGTKLRNQVFKVKSHLDCLRALENLEPHGLLF